MLIKKKWLIVSNQNVKTELKPFLIKKKISPLFGNKLPNNEEWGSPFHPLPIPSIGEVRKEGKKWKGEREEQKYKRDENTK